MICECGAIMVLEYYFCLNCEMIVKLDNSPTKFLCECCHRPEIVYIKNPQVIKKKEG